MFVIAMNERQPKNLKIALMSNAGEYVIMVVQSYNGVLAIQGPGR